MIWPLLLFALAFGDDAADQGTDLPRVRVEVAPGPYFVGQGFALSVGVVGVGRRPKIDPPRLTGARAWMIDTEVRPISATGIGSLVDRQNLYVVRFRVVPERAGALEIPAIAAQIERRSGRSRPQRLSIQPVPLQGRSAAFLGGVGRFEVSALASPQVVRVGQELDFRITITGPAAWGATERPELARYDRVPLGLRIEPRPDETSDEPPARTFVYRLRPSRAGEDVLPPVAIAAFEPSISRYVTRVTAGVPLRVVAVPSFDPATIDYDLPPTSAGLPGLVAWAAAASLLLAAWMMLSRVRRRRERSRPRSPDLARRFAKWTARHLVSVSLETHVHPFEPANAHVQAELLDFDRTEPAMHLFRLSRWYRPRARTIKNGASPEIVQSTARRIAEQLAIYLRLGTGGSHGALTPDEARQGVARLTRSDDLASQADRLAARCDRILYGDLPREPGEDARQLVDDARRLFEALGRMKISRNGG